MKDNSYIASLVKKVKKNDTIAMRSLYEAHAKQMLATSLRITNSKDDAEDTLHEAFIQSFEKIAQLKQNESYSGWLKRIVITKSLALVKKRIVFEELSDISAVQEKQDQSEWYRDISYTDIKKELQNLPDGCRTIFSLYLLEGYKHKEISEELNISVSNSKSQYRYALKLLREKLHHKIYE